MVYMYLFDGYMTLLLVKSGECYLAAGRDTRRCGGILLHVPLIMEDRGPYRVDELNLDGALLFLFQAATIRRAMETMAARQPSSNTCICTTGRSRTTFSSVLQQRGINTDAGRLGFNAALAGGDTCIRHAHRPDQGTFRRLSGDGDGAAADARDARGVRGEGMNCNGRMARPNIYVSL